MTQTTLKPIVLSILLISTPILSQAHETDQSVDLDEVTVVGKSRPRATSGLLHTSTASDKIISGDTLRQKAVNLGDALDGVPGIHASQYGGGASAPVIRGQTGRRIKVLNHHGETGDMA
ncbi:TonB-dependent receptor plug domain-containing protein, partial [Neisseria sp. P0006.S006]